MKNNAEEIFKLKQKLEKLELEQKKFDKLPDNVKLAEIIHDKFCTKNHTDGCDWNYHKWFNNNNPNFIQSNIGHAKEEYLEKANNIIKLADYSLISKIIFSI